MSINLTDPEVEFITASFYKKEKNWLVLAYSPQRDKLVLYGAGSDGISECERTLDAVGEDVAYALVRTEDEGEGGKIAFVTYVGEGVGGVKRARATVHGRLVGSKLFIPTDLTCTIHAASELSSSLQNELILSAPSPSQSNRSHTPRQHSPPLSNGASSDGHHHQPQGEERGSSSPLPPPPPPSSSSSTQQQPPDLPHLHTLGPVQPHPIFHSQEVSSDPTAPLPSPLKELPSPPPFVPEPSFPTSESSSRRPSYPPPDEQEHRNGSHLTSPISHPRRDLAISPPSPSQPSPQTEQPIESRSSNPISRLSSLSNSKPSSPTDSNFSSKSSSSMGRPSIPLFSSLSILSRRGKGRSGSAGSGPPPVPPKDGPKTPTSFSHFPIGTPQKPIVEEPPVSTIRGLDYSFRPRVASTLSPSSPPISAPSHQHQQPPVPKAIIVKSPTDRSLTNEDAYDDAYDAYDAYDERPGSPPPPKPSTIPSSSILPRKLPSPPQFPKSMKPNPSTSPSNPISPLDLTKPRFPTLLSQNYPTHRSISSPSQPLPSHRTSSETAITSSLQTLEHFRRASASKEFDGATPSGWLKEEQQRRLDEDREQMNDRRAAQKKTAEREEKEGLERRRLKEEERRQEDTKREEEKVERLRLAKERTVALELKEKERKEEEEKKKEKAALEKREKEEMEMARVKVELAKARIAGGRLADGWLTVQAPNSVLFRRRYFYILPSKLDLFKSPEEVSKPMTTISLPPNIEITDAYEEIQVLHSFRIESADGKTFLFYCDSEADKEVVVEALKVASKA